MNLRERAGLVATVSSALARGEHTLAILPDLICQIIEQEAWKEFETKMGQHVTYDRFEDFVTTPPLAGLGTSMELIKRIVKDNPVTLDKLDQALQRPEGKPGHTVYNVHGIERPSGNSEEVAIRRLRKDRPDLHARVLTGEMSAHAAMREAKFRRPTMTVTLDSPKSARLLVTRASPEFLSELRRLLCDRQTT